MFRFRHTALAALVLAALLAGCGGDDADSDAGAGDTSSVDVTDQDQEADDATGSGDGTGSDDGTGSEDEADEADEQGGETAAAIPDACTLVDDAELGALVPGAEPEPEEGTAIDGLDYSQCTWETEETTLIVAVVEGSTRFEMHQDHLQGEPLDGVGEDALVATGVSSETRGDTGGRTVSALVDGNTLSVALRLTGQTTNEDVVPLATAVVERAAAG